MFVAKDHPIYKTLGEVNPKAIVFPEFNQAYMGLGINKAKTVAVYDWNLVIAIMVNQHDMKPSDAKEFVYLNVITQTQSEDAPIFLQQTPIDEIEHILYF